MDRRLLATVALAATLPLSGAETTILDRADSAWSHRDRRLDSGSLDPGPTREAIALWEEALARNPDERAIPFRLIEALWFEATFLETDRRRQEDAADRILALAEETFERSGADTARSHFWAAVAWGFWGMRHGNLASAARDVAGKVRDHAQRVLELDPAFADGGGARLLGRLHTVAPRVPFFTGWIDRERGIELLETALATSDRDPRNALFLAEALLRFRPGRRGEALALLRVLAARKPDPRWRVEQGATLAEARHLLGEESGG